ncbi:MAG: hypothetical protein H0V95_07350 [Actinobacteria bacterium]|nr:hypothetical protein [Actinomycetota bacterium]
MAVEKYSASMDAETLAEARKAAEDQGVTLSAWLAEAARDRVRLLGLERLIKDYEEEFGEITEEEMEASRRRLYDGPWI